MTGGANRSFFDTGRGGGRRVVRRPCLLLVVVAFLLTAGCTTTPSTGQRDSHKQALASRDLGIDYLGKGFTAMAIRNLEQARELDPTDASTYLSLGEAYRRKGMFDRAEQHLLHSLELNSDSSDYNHQETVLNLSALYVQLQRYEEAAERCQSLVDDPTFATPWRALTNRGWAEFKQGKLAEARKSFERAIDFHPRYSPAHLDLAILEQQERRPLQAMRHLERALEGKRLGADGIAEVNYRMAEIYISLGKRGKAIEHFNVALERSPYGQWGSQSKSYLELLR